MKLSKQTKIAIAQILDADTKMRRGVMTADVILDITAVVEAQEDIEDEDTAFDVALRGWQYEVIDSNNFDNFDPNPEWEDWAVHENQNLDSVATRQAVMVSKGGARVYVSGDVGPGAIILCGGGGAEVEINGNVMAGARILAMGGGAVVEIRGHVDPTAQVIARGGSAKVLLHRPLNGHATNIKADGGGAAVLTPR